MKTQKYLKISALLFVFLLSYVGLTFTTHTKKIAGQYANISLVSIGTTAKAYCNEATFWGEHNTGICNGTFNQPESKCLAKTVSDGDPNCVR